MVFTVTGSRDGVPYRVGIHPDGVDHPDAVGVAMGSTDTIADIRLNTGEEFQASPTSEPVTLNPDDAASVLAFLYATTDVGAVDGDDIPDVRPVEADHHVQ